MTNILDGSAIRFHPSATEGDGGPTIHVGVSFPPGLSGNQLVLTQKGVRDCCAAVDFVRKNAPRIAEWKTALGLGRDPVRPFNGIRIVVEDASPDTCVALLELARRVVNEELPDSWVQAACDWEMGFSPPDPMSSWGTHHNALVHAILDKGDLEVTVPQALRDGIAYTDALVRANADPFRLPASFSDSRLQSMHLRARSLLETERADYRNLRAHALCVQLEIPLLHSDRQRLVDAMFIAEEAARGSIKTFARADQSSWTGAGHVFGGYYRPQSPNGGDITFSVSAESGLSLLPLWHELELLEDLAWGDDRPRDKPRADVVAFGEELHGVRPSNDPWWDGGESHSLVAAPGKCGIPTRLTWESALDAVWRRFAPGRTMAVRRRGSEAPGVPLGDAPAVATAAEQLCEGTKLRLLDLDRLPGVGEPLITWCPTLEAALAALTEGGLPKLGTLPDSSSFDLIRVGTGAAIVTAGGLLLLRSDADPRFPADAMRAAALDAARTLATATRLEEQLVHARLATRTAIPGGRIKHRRDALTKIYAIQLEARQHWPTTPPTGGGAVNALRDSCERRWRSEARFHQVLDEAKELEAMIASSAENRASTLLNSIALYGFPAALFGNVLGAAFGPVANSGSGFWDVALNAVLWFFALTLLLSSILFIVAQISGARWKRGLSPVVLVNSNENDGGASEAVETRSRAGGR